MTNRRFGLTVSCCAMLAFALAAPAHATPSLDFNISLHPGVGTISYAGGTNPLVGAGILVDRVIGLDTPLHAGTTLSLTNAILSFTSGPFSSYTETASGIGEWVFSGGGWVRVVGIVPALGPDSRTLMTGTFTYATVDSLGTFRVAIAAFIDDKDPGLVGYFWGANPPHGFQGDMNLSFSATTTASHAFTSTQVYSGDVYNEALPCPDLASSLLLFAISLAGVWTARRAWFR